MRFPIRLALREIRGSLPHFRFFLICVALGVGALIGVGNLSANLSGFVLREAKTLLAADLEIRLSRSFSIKDEEILDPLKRQGVQVVRVSELLAMASRPDGSTTQLVELKAVELGYPFYGKLQWEPREGRKEPPVGTEPQGTLAQEGLALRLGLKIGEPFHLGDATLYLRGILRSEPDRVAGPFSLGPRVLISQEALRASGLIQPGSRVRYRYLLKIPPALDLEEVRETLSKAFREEGAEVRTYRDAQPRLERLIKNLMTYIGLVGLMTLLTGGIGVALNVRAYLGERKESLATLKSLGATSGELLAAYLIQILLLALLGCFLGLLLGVGLQRFLLHQASGFLPSDLSFGEGGRLVVLSIARAILMGLLTALLFALPPLLAARLVSPARLFRQEVEVSTRSARPIHPLLAVVAASLAALALWQAGSLRLGLWVLGALILSVGFLWGMTLIVLSVLRIFPKHALGLSFRQGLANLYRPGNQSLSVVVSLGVGATALLTLTLVQGSLMDHLRENLPSNAPSLFFIDLQPDQKDRFEKILTEWPLEDPPRLTPLVRSRLTAIDGKKISEMQIGGRPDGWYFTREYVLTEQRELPKHNRIIRGAWWSSESRSDGPHLSVEAEAARHLGIGLGSLLTFDIQGTEIEGRVESLREVDWGSFTTNFFMIFSPSSLSGSPTTYVAEVRIPPRVDLPLQAAVVQAFPNVTAIPLREVLEGIARFLERMAFVIRSLALLSLLAGLVVLSGALAATRFQRLREMAILKVLGATRPDLLRMLAVEYLLLGGLTGIASSLLSIPLAYGVIHFLLDVPWTFHPERVIEGIGGTALLTAITGLLMTYKTIGKRPLGILRTE